MRMQEINRKKLSQKNKTFSRSNFPSSTNNFLGNTNQHQNLSSTNNSINKPNKKQKHHSEFFYINHFLIITILLSSTTAAFQYTFPTARATLCTSEYVCGSWSSCEDGLQSRTCEDVKCGRRDIIEREFCGDLENCAPLIECKPWSDCTYTEKVDNFLQGEIKFGGYKTRLCSDRSNCIAPFMEESSCEETFSLRLEKAEQCGEEFLTAVDPKSNRQVARISKVGQDSLNIFFTQGETQYCSSCYNTIKDANEEGVDCGGPCKACRQEKEFPITALIVASWLLAALFTALFAIEYRAKKKYNKLFNNGRSLE